MNLQNPFKRALVSLIIFLLLLAVTPMFSWQTACIGGHPLYGCAPKTSFYVYFPMYRTVVCKIWSEPGCAPGTFLPDWYHSLINPVNLLIIAILVVVSLKVSKNFLNKN